MKDPEIGLPGEENEESNVITLLDEEGAGADFVILDRAEIDGAVYYALSELNGEEYGDEEYEDEEDGDGEDEEDEEDEEDGEERGSGEDGEDADDPGDEEEFMILRMTGKDEDGSLSMEEIDDGDELRRVFEVFRKRLEGTAELRF